MLRVFIKKMLGGPQESYILPTKEKLFRFLKKNSNQEVHIDFPKGSMKGFVGVDALIPFDYGEWPNLINPADDMGWDLIVVPTAAGRVKNMKPVGYVNYDADLKPHKRGNDKIIVAPSAIYSKGDKEVIEGFFDPIEHFEEVVWLR